MKTHQRMKNLALLLCTAAALLAVAAIPTLAAEEKPKPKTLFSNVHVFDGVNEKRIENTNVLVEGNLIKQVSTEKIAADGATVIDGGGRTLMPGLMDMHVHLTWNQGMGALLDSTLDYIGALALVEAKNTLMRGITTIRDTGGPVKGVQRAIDEGHHVGPRIYVAGAGISMTSGHTDFRSRNVFPRQLGGPGVTELEMLRGTVIADGVPEVLSASREQFRQGSDFLKVMAGGAVSGLRDPLDVAEYSDEELQAAVGEAKRWNTYVAVHAYTDHAITSALNAGVMAIEHGNLITEPTMKLLVKKGAFLNAQTSVYLTPFPEGVSDEQRVRQKEAADGLDNMMKLAKKHKAKITFGTDLVGSLEVKSTHLDELTNRLEWFTPVEILRQATSIAGELAALSGRRNPYPGKLGVIEEGALADLLLVEGNPLENLEVMTDPENNLMLIMKDGKIYKNTLR